MARIKIGDKVMSPVGKAYVHAIQRAKPYPYYLHEERKIPDGTPLVGPFKNHELSVIDAEED